MRLKIKNAVLAIALSGAFATVSATPLIPNTLSANVDIVASFFGGTLLDTAITNISNFGYNGTARAAVYDSGSGLDFYYQFSNNASSLHGVERFSFYDFTSLNAELIDVYQTATAFGIFVTGTESSDYADRTNFGVLGISFVPNGFSKIDPGTSSYIQIVRTNATEYMPGYFGLLNGFGDNAAGFAPTVAAVVPEPGSAPMLLAGLGLIGAIGRRYRG